MTKSVFPRVAWTVLVLGLVLLAFVFAHWNTPRGGFLSDDFHYIAHTHSPTPNHVLRCLVLEKQDPFYYRPLNTMMFQIDSLLWGNRAAGFHLSNLFLHLMNSILIYVLSTLFLRNRAGALTVAALFLLCPLQPEAVTWISGRCGLLATFFYLCCMICYWRYRTTGRSWFFVLTVASGMLGILSKELALSFPLTLLVMEFVFFRREGGGQTRSTPRALYFTLAIPPVYFCMRLLLLGKVASPLLYMYQQSVPEVSPLMVIPGLLLHVLANVTIRPFLVFMDPFNGLEVTPPWLPIAYGLTGLTLLAAGLRSGTFRNRVAVFALLGFSVSLLPASVFFNAAPGLNLQSARFLYAPSIFVCLYLGNLAFGRAGPGPGTRSHGVVRLALVLVLGLIMTIGLRQNNRPWLEASRISSRILTEFKHLSPKLQSPARILIEGLPDNHHGAYIFRTGVAQAVNLAMGCLPTFRYPPDMNKTAYEFHYVVHLLPYKVLTPEMFQTAAWTFSQKILDGLEVEVPSWITPDPDDYDHHLRWNPVSETLDLLK